MTDRVTELREKRAFYDKLGKRKKVDQIDAVLIPLVTEQMAMENLREQIARDIEWIGRLSV